MPLPNWTHCLVRLNRALMFRKQEKVCINIHIFKEHLQIIQKQKRLFGEFSRQVEGEKLENHVEDIGVGPLAGACRRTFRRPITLKGNISRCARTRYSLYNFKATAHAKQKLSCYIWSVTKSIRYIQLLT